MGFFPCLYAFGFQLLTEVLTHQRVAVEGVGFTGVFLRQQMQLSQTLQSKLPFGFGSFLVCIRQSLNDRRFAECIYRAFGSWPVEQVS